MQDELRCVDCGNVLVIADDDGKPIPVYERDQLPSYDGELLCDECRCKRNRAQ